MIAVLVDGAFTAPVDLALSPRRYSGLMTSPLSFAQLALAALTLTCAAPSMAQTVTPASGRAVVLNPLSIVNTSDLDFGTLVRGTAAGTAMIAPASGDRTTSGGTVAAGGSPGAATFVATGVLNRVHVVALGPAPVLSNGTGGLMTVSALMLDGPTLRLFGPGGVSTIRVGGVLAVGANQAEGDYTGTFQVTVIYL